jgi:PBP1b-binding outer membrane lipoprotein LpoB
MARSWADDFRARNGRAPAVIVGRVRNLSHEHLNTSTFVKDLERAWVDSGRVRVVAAGTQRDELRSEREDQARHASLETAKNMGRELGADFMLQGQIDSILDSADGQTVRYYQVELELIDIETNEKTWIGQKKLKKLVSRSRYRW